MVSNEQSDLNWLATQYVLGELPDVDRDAFERRLETDLAACEAVAAATQLSMGIRAALVDARVATTQPGPTRNRSLLATIAAAITVASALLVLGSWKSIDVDPGFVDLVSRWRTGAPSMEIKVEDTDLEMIDSASDEEVPDWLIAGVAIEQQGAEGNPDQTKDN